MIALQHSSRGKVQALPLFLWQNAITKRNMTVELYDVLSE